MQGRPGLASVPLKEALAFTGPDDHRLPARMAQLGCALATAAANDRGNENTLHSAQDWFAKARSLHAGANSALHLRLVRISGEALTQVLELSGMNADARGRQTCWKGASTQSRRASASNYLHRATLEQLLLFSLVRPARSLTKNTLGLSAFFENSSCPLRCRKPPRSYSGAEATVHSTRTA